MLSYLQKLLAGADAFLVTVYMADGDMLERRGLIGADLAGIAVDCDPYHEPHDPAPPAARLVPWCMIRTVDVDITG